MVDEENVVPDRGTVLSEAAVVPAWLHVGAAWAWRLGILVVVGLAMFSLLSQMLVVSLPVIIAVILCTLCVPVADRLRALGLPDSAAALIVVGGGIGLFAGFIALVAPSFADQVADLGSSLEAGYDDVLTWLEEGPLGVDRQQIQDLYDRAQSSFEGGGSGGSSVFTGVLTGIGAVAQGVTALALTVILLFFFVKDGEDIVGWMIERTPERSRDTVRAVGHRAWRALGGYVRGTATIALINAVGIGIGLAVLGVPLVLPLSLLVFLGAFIPVIGAFLAGLVAVLVALADGGPVTAGLVLAVIVGVQQLEGNLLQPLIMKRAVALHPVVILVALAAGGTLFGIVGAFLSVPVAAVVAAAGNELRLRNEGSSTTAQDEAGAPA